MPPTEAPTLAELQAGFQAAIVDGVDDVLALIPANSRTSNAVLLGVYRHAYVARLVEVVRGAYPLLAQYMGDVAFEHMARRYVALYPSRHVNARWFGSDVPELLSREFADAPELRDLARIEWQLDLAFDAVDAPVLDLAALADFPPEAWGGLSFVPHPSAVVLTLGTNAFEIWRAMKDEVQELHACILPEPLSYLVWRRDGIPCIRRLEGEERMLWIEAQRGKTFGGLAEMASAFDAPDTAALRMAQYLNAWLAAGQLSKAHDVVTQAS